MPDEPVFRINPVAASMNKPAKSNPRSRSLARTRAMQALYQWDMAGQTLSSIESQFMEEQDMSKVDVAYFRELLHGIPGMASDLDRRVAPYLDRALEEVDPIERAILRIAVFEFLRRMDVPYRVVINEAVELAKRFGAEQGHKFVNGVLDKVAKELRAVETTAAGQKART
jgi:N utilization substance protein B